MADASSTKGEPPLDDDKICRAVIGAMLEILLNPQKQDTPDRIAAASVLLRAVNERRAAK